jgi:hypothetical protein
MQRLSPRRIIIFVALGCYAASLCLPAFSYIPYLASSPPQTVYMPGWLPLVCGGIAALFMQVAAFSNLANPVFFAASLAYGFGKNRISATLAVISMLIGASFFPLSSSHPVLIPFSGRGETLNHPEPMIGFVLWMTSFLLIFLGSIASYTHQKLAKRTNAVARQ